MIFLLASAAIFLLASAVIFLLASAAIFLVASAAIFLVASAAILLRVSAAILLWVSAAILLRASSTRILRTGTLHLSIASELVAAVAMVVGWMSVTLGEGESSSHQSDRDDGGNNRFAVHAKPLMMVRKPAYLTVSMPTFEPMLPGPIAASSPRR